MPKGISKKEYNRYSEFIYKKNQKALDEIKKWHPQTLTQHLQELDYPGCKVL